MTPAPNKATLIQKIKNLEGLSQDERAVLIELVNTKKKYGLVWEDKPEEVEEQLRENLPVLREVVEKRIIGADLPADEPESTAAETQLSLMPEDESEEKTNNTPKPAPNHILIEGDNLHALTALTFTHEGEIDVIYIDPPYNTGNKDFKYNDSFVDREDSYRHSKWLSFMHKRLVIAKRLLSESGVIFISIDDNAVAQLKLLCDDILGEANFIQDLIWFNKYTVSNDAKYFSKQHDYVLVYSKNSLNTNIKLLPRDDKANSRYKNPDNDKRGPWKATPLDARSGGSSNIFEVKFPNGVIWKPTIGRYAVHNKDKILDLYKDNRLWFGKNNQTKPSKKTFLSEVSQGMKCGSILHYDTFGHTHKANDQLSDVIGKGKFTSPKSLDLIKNLFFLSSQSDSILLDFFAGSGTTLHATMNLNQEDGGNRQCILVTNNENNICEEVTYERNKRVIEGYTNSKGEFVKGLKNNNLRYYKSEFVGRERTVNNKIKITRLATELLCIKEDIYDEVSQLGSFAINAKEVRAFAKDNLYLLVIYTETIIEEMASLIEKIVEQTEGEKPHFKIYVFSNGQYPYNEEFEDVAAYVTLCALPDAIYKAYQHILPSRTPRQVPTLEEPGTEEVEDAIDNQPNLFNQPPN
ncbi:MAG: site-specific DNA-methyltransferase [Bacteroidota bacterium]